MSNEKDKSALVSIILFILSIIFIVFMKSFIGSIFAIITLIISSINLKRKTPLVIVSFIGSILLTIYSIIAFVISFNVVNNTISSAKIKSYKMCEEVIKSDAEKYISQLDLAPTQVGEERIMTFSKTEISNNCNYCDGYVVADINNHNYDVYLKCDNYKTDGFDSQVFEKANK